MSTSALSSAQFGNGSALRPQAVEDPVPLSYSNLTDNTAKQAAAWRKPSPTMPLSDSTRGSLFQPYQQQPNL